MATFIDLYEKQSVVGAKLASYLEVNDITKRELFDLSGVSRPTIDKILNGTITSSTNYQKHIEKILKALKLTPDFFLGNAHIIMNRIREFRVNLGMRASEVSERTGIAEERLKAIEEGEKATLSELRDIAFCLGTGVDTILGKSIFMGQVSKMDDFVFIKSDELSGFWGHIGILPKNGKKYRWYPISSGELGQIMYSEDCPYLLVPCMNNRVLFINKKQVNKIKFLDEACDEPVNSDWDYNVSNGEIPLVVYDALAEYVEEGPDGEMSETFHKIMELITERYNITEDNVYDMVNKSHIIYADGYEEEEWIDFENSEELCDVMDLIYTYYEDEIDSIVKAETTFEEAILLNLDNISVLDMPYLQLERGIGKIWDEDGLREEV